MKLQLHCVAAASQFEVFCAIKSCRSPYLRLPIRSFVLKTESAWFSVYLKLYFYVMTKANESLW